MGETNNNNNNKKTKVLIEDASLKIKEREEKQERAMNFVSRVYLPPYMHACIHIYTYLADERRASSTPGLLAVSVVKDRVGHHSVDYGSVGCRDTIQQETPTKVGEEKVGEIDVSATLRVLV